MALMGMACTLAKVALEGLMEDSVAPLLMGAIQQLQVERVQALVEEALAHQHPAQELRPVVEAEVALALMGLMEIAISMLLLEPEAVPMAMPGSYPSWVVLVVEVEEAQITQAIRTPVVAEVAVVVPS
jgi:hypothetical protein